MARLILQEGDRTRRFKLNEGTLTIGSGASATVTVESEEIAEVHVELEFRDGRAMLRPRPGVAPVSVQGRKVQGEVALKPGVTARFGDVRVSIELEEAATPGKSGTKPRAGAAGGVSRSAGGGGGASRVQRTRRTTSGGPSVPSWLIVVGVLAVAAGGYAMLDNFAADAGAREFDAKASQVRIEQKLASADFSGVLREFEEKIDVQEGLDPEWKALFEGYRKEALALKAEAEEIARNKQGNDYFETQLRKYVDGYLEDNGRPQARVLMKRMKSFQDRWPTHPEVDWCDRMKRRFESIADMSSPDTWADIEWEVKTLTWAKPRYYRDAFALLERFYQSAEGSDRDAALALMEEKETEQKEFFDDRMLEAKHQYEYKKDYSAALGELVQLVMHLNDQDMATRAAEMIVAMPYIEGAMAGIQRERPDDFALLAANPVMRKYFEEKGLL